MAGEIQLNSTTMATELSGSITAQLDTLRPNTTNGSLVLQGDSSDAGVTGLTIDSSGNATFAQTISGGTLGSSVVFPAGHVIRTLTFSSTTQITDEADTYLPINDTINRIQIPNYTYGNTIIIQTVISVEITEGTASNIVFSSKYKIGGTLGSPSDPTSATYAAGNSLGKIDVLSSSAASEHIDNFPVLDVLTLTGSGTPTTHLDYTIYCDFGSNQSHILTTNQKRFLIVQEIQQ